MGLLPGSTFGPFSIIAYIGGGGMAEVYQAQETLTKRIVALKILTSILVPQPEYQRRFLIEAEVLGKLQHPHIIPLYTANIENGVPWISMQYATGGALSKAIAAAALPFQRILAILTAVAEALDFAHGHPDAILHRDVKPANILLGDADRIYLGDFGLAKIAQGTPGLSASGIVIGTAEYMAPEQTRGDLLDRRCDIYGLGVVAYELIVGHIPFNSTETDNVKRHREIVQKHQLSPMPENGVPPHVVPILRKCLAKRADERYARASEFVNALRETLTDTITIVRPATPAATPVHPDRPSDHGTYDPNTLDDTDRDEQDSRLLRRERQVALVHLTDIKIPPGNSPVSWLWHRRWSHIAAEIERQDPHVLVVTGSFFDRTNLRWLTARASWRQFTTDVTQRFGNAILVFAPSTRDRAFIEEFTRRQEESPHVIVPEHPALKTGWRDVVENTLHIYNVNSRDDDGWFAPAISDLRAEQCGATEHIHVAVMHHYVRPDSTGQGADEDADDRLQQLASLGFDLVLYGQRQDAKKTYVDPLPQRKQRVWLVPAPAKPPLSGFNLIAGRTDGSFEVRAFRHEKAGWRSQTIVSEEQGRLRQWRAQRRTAPGCDTLEVHIELYQPEDARDPNKPAAHLRCGDLRVKMTLHHPMFRDDHLPVPLGTIVGYNATAWRALQAVAINPTGPPTPLPINADGTIRVTTAERRTIEVSAIILNALPTAIGDWSRMQASQPDLQELFRFQTTVAARFLRAHIRCPHLLRLVPGRQANSTAETEFLTVQSDKEGDEVTLFRPVIGVSYGLAFKGEDPVHESIGLIATDLVPATPAEDGIRDPLEWQHAVANLLNMPGTSAYQTIQNALDTLRSKFIEAIKPMAPERATKDITVDLLSVGDQLRVVMNDSKQELHKVAPPSLGLTFVWGEGIAGRSLRLTQAYGWSQHKYSGAEATWPADEWYFKHPKMVRHEHVYCRPIAIWDEQGKPYVIAIISFATHKKSMLRDLIRAFRAHDKNIESQCDAACERFTTTLLEELA